jgi:hypothetical protein
MLYQLEPLGPWRLHRRFVKISGRMWSLNLGASFAPRIEHAAVCLHRRPKF